MREKRRLKIFENRVLKIFWPKRDEVTREWRKLHNKELFYLYLRNIIRPVKSRRCAGRVARIVEIRGAYRVLVRKRE